jgi:Tol biopolymer transport system component
MSSHHILGAALAAVALAIPTAASAAPPGTVVWTREDFANNDFQLYLARADGTTGAVPLTNPSFGDPAVCFEGCGAENGDWLPDGSRIYFDASWIPFVSLWSIKPDATDVQKDPSITEFDGIPGISPDGTLVAFEGGSLDASQEGIYLKPLGAATATRLTTDPAAYYDSSADVSPDNQRIVFSRVYAGNGARVEIWVIDTDGTGLHRLLSSGRRWSDAHFSPDGSKILVQSYDERANQGRNSNEYVMNADGTNLRPLTHEPWGGFAFSGDWSPDGRHIVYMRFRQGDENIAVRSMDANGNDEGKIADCDFVAFCDNPSWGVYEGALPATANAQIRSTHATPRRHVSRRTAARRLYRRVVRELSR